MPKEFDEINVEDSSSKNEFKTSSELSDIALQIRDHILDYDITKSEAMIIAGLISIYMNDYFTRIGVDQDLNGEND